MPQAHPQGAQAGDRSRSQDILENVTNEWPNTASGSGSTMSFLPLPLDLVRSWLHVQTSPRENLLPSGTDVPERTAIPKGKAASQARRPQSLSENWQVAGRPPSPLSASAASRSGQETGSPAWQGAQRRLPCGHPNPLRVVGATFISEMPSGVPCERLSPSSCPFLLSLGQESPQSPPSLWLEGCSRLSPSAWESSANLGAPFLFPRVRVLLTVGTVPPPSHTPSTTQLAQPSPGDFCCRPFPHSHPGPHVGAFNPRGGGGGGGW